ncbi:hypothetical protein B1C78_08920 [Thioalkalivibrio denitrificans]|uniref:Uncharacterized protein n=1 Tax=Thioalkalivibrio denitrificans TaxID=108003 RepID=A0A1V3NGV9_9GAMM|nr:hypothetical protein [Thioalkalivibrio denitrificans]OOG24329.1 hypothetical protein B1C78_08920 [Thioalkalivibrio denitrificans]
MPITMPLFAEHKRVRPLLRVSARLLGCLLPAIAAMAPATASQLAISEAIAVARTVSERFVEVCRDHTPAQSRRHVLADDRFAPYGDPQATAPGDELHRIDSASLSAWNLNLTVRVSEHRCQLAVWPNADRVYMFLIPPVSAWPGVRLNHEGVPEGGSMSDLRQYRSDPWEADDHYRVVEIMRFAGDSAVIGKYRRDRARTQDLVNNPGARWEVIRDDERTAAQQRLHDHRLLLIPARDGGSAPVFLEFHPRFYLYKHRGEESHPLYYAHQMDVLIDGQAIPAFEACTARTGNCARNAQRFRLTLDRDSAERIMSGRTLTLYARTTLGEEFEFQFAMQGAREALGQARVQVIERFTELLAAVRPPRATPPRPRVPANAFSADDARFCAREARATERAAGALRETEAGLEHERARIETERSALNLLASRAQSAQLRASSCRNMGAMQGGGCFTQQQQYEQLRGEYADRARRLDMSVTDFSRRVRAANREEERLSARLESFDRRCMSRGLTEDLYRQVCVDGPDAGSRWCAGFDF